DSALAARRCPEATLLKRNPVTPDERGRQRKRFARVRLIAKLRSGDLQRHRLQLRCGRRRKRPLREPEITRAEGRERAVVPRLLAQPLDGRGAVAAFVDEGIELAARSEGAAHTLQDDLEAALGNQAREHGTERTTAAVRRTNQYDGPPRDIARAVAVGNERD